LARTPRRFELAPQSSSTCRRLQQRATNHRGNRRLATCTRPTGWSPEAPCLSLDRCNSQESRYFLHGLVPSGALLEQACRPSTSAQGLAASSAASAGASAGASKARGATISYLQAPALSSQFHSSLIFFFPAFTRGDDSYVPACSDRFCDLLGPSPSRPRPLATIPPSAPPHEARHRAATAPRKISSFCKLLAASRATSLSNHDIRRW
jgi:hypothetical protein